jgi:transcriptional regulator with XRE-family HTH domain
MSAANAKRASGASLKLSQGLIVGQRARLVRLELLASCSGIPYVHAANTKKNYTVAKILFTVCCASLDYGMPERVDLTTVGARLRFARSQKHLRQADVAEHLRVAGSRVSEWENDVYIPNSTNLDQLAELYGVSTSWLLRETGRDGPLQTGSRWIMNRSEVKFLSEQADAVASRYRARRRQDADAGELERLKDQLRTVIRNLITASLPASAAEPAGIDRVVESVVQVATGPDDIEPDVSR